MKVKLTQYIMRNRWLVTFEDGRKGDYKIVGVPSSTLELGKEFTCEPLHPDHRPSIDTFGGYLIVKDPAPDYIDFGDIARSRMHQQCQYASRYFNPNPIPGYTYLGEGLSVTTPDP